MGPGYFGHLRLLMQNTVQDSVDSSNSDTRVTKEFKLTGRRGIWKCNRGLRHFRISGLNSHDRAYNGLRSLRLYKIIVEKVEKFGKEEDFRRINRTCIILEIWNQLCCAVCERPAARDHFETKIPFPFLLVMSCL